LVRDCGDVTLIDPSMIPALMVAISPARLEETFDA
jgi:hypothetical protein